MKQSDTLARLKQRLALQVKWPLFTVGTAEQVTSLVGNVLGDPVRRPRRFENIPDDGWEIALLNLSDVDSLQSWNDRDVPPSCLQSP